VPFASVTLPAPTDARPEAGGRLNVVEPSPPPHAVPIAAKSCEYVALDTLLPSQMSHPGGAFGPAKSATTPTGMAMLTNSSNTLKLLDNLAPHESLEAPTSGKTNCRFSV
jgi:hypothetical protein